MSFDGTVSSLDVLGLGLLQPHRVSSDGASFLGLGLLQPHLASRFVGVHLQGSHVQFSLQRVISVVFLSQPQLELGLLHVLHLRFEFSLFALASSSSVISVVLQQGLQLLVVQQEVLHDVLQHDLQLFVLQHDVLQQFLLHERVALVLEQHVLHLLEHLEEHLLHLLHDEQVLHVCLHEQHFERVTDVDFLEQHDCLHELHDVEHFGLQEHVWHDLHDARVISSSAVVDLRFVVVWVVVVVPQHVLQHLLVLQQEFLLQDLQLLVLQHDVLQQFLLHARVIGLALEQHDCLHELHVFLQQGLQEHVWHELHDLRVIDLSVLGFCSSSAFIVLQQGLQLLVLQQEVLHVALQHDLHDEALQQDVLQHEVLQQLVLQQPARVISLHSPRKFNAV